MLEKWKLSTKNRVLCIQHRFRGNWNIIVTYAYKTITTVDTMYGVRKSRWMNVVEFQLKNNNRQVLKCKLLRLEMFSDLIVKHWNLVKIVVGLFFTTNVFRSPPNVACAFECVRLACYKVCVIFWTVRTPICVVRTNAFVEFNIYALLQWIAENVHVFVFCYFAIYMYKSCWGFFFFCNKTLTSVWNANTSGDLTQV